MIYGYCRTSTKHQKIDRQISNILKQFPDAEIYQEAFTGTKLQGRKELDKILKKVRSGDTIVFDEVSRMSRNADEGFALYKDLFQNGVNLVFLKEPHINTDTYRSAMTRQIELTGSDEDILFEGINKYLLRLAEKQIKLAFEQAQKEVDYLHKRTSEGMKAAGVPNIYKTDAMGNYVLDDKNKKIVIHQGTLSIARTGKKYETDKAIKAKEVIKKHNKGFGGNLTNEETWTLAGISKMTFYRYQKEIIEEEQLS